MPFWVILIKIAKLVMTVRKYAALLQGLSSGKLVESLIAGLVIGEVRDGLVKAGIPIDHFDFQGQASQWIDRVIDEASGDLAKHSIVVAPDALRRELRAEIARLLTGKSVANGRTPERGQRRSADPVILHRGEFEHITTDLFVRGAGIDLGFRRVYRSGADYIGRMGRGWDHTFNLRLFEHSPLTLSRLTGQLATETFFRHPRFGESAFDYFIPPNGTHHVVVPTLAGSFRLLQPGGGRIEYERCGADEHRATTIVSPGDHQLSLAYDADDRLIRVTANSPGRFVGMSYDSRNRLASVVDHSGRFCEYDYDAWGFLAAASQRVDVGGRRHVNMETYDYEPVGESRKLARVRDERGQILVGNVYDVRSTSPTLGFVQEQTIEAGRTTFVYEPIQARAPDLKTVDAPSLRVFETGPGGHVIERVFNDAGNELLRREDFTDGQRRRTALIRTRYNADGAVVARMDPEGGLSQHLYGRDLYDPPSDWADVPTSVSDITLTERQSFGNTLATVIRGLRLSEMTIGAEQAEWLAALPPVRLRQAPTDVVVKYAYDPATQLLVSESDSAYTHSPDPLHVESAPSGSPAHNPSHPLAIAHHAHRKTKVYSSDGVPIESAYPNRSRPPAFGATVVNGIRERVRRRDGKGRALETEDRRGYVTYNEYYPDAATPPASMRAGFLKRQLQPFFDWHLNEDTPNLLEIRLIGSWTSAAGSLTAAGSGSAVVFTTRGARLELWQHVDGVIPASHVSVQVTVDGTLHGMWDQSTHAAYLIDSLTGGAHTVELQGTVAGTFAVGRVLGHAATDYDVDILGRVVREVDGRGVPIERTFDALDREVATTHGLAGAVTKTAVEFNREGDVVRERRTWTDGAGSAIGGGAVVTSYTYDFRGLRAHEKTGAVDGTPSRTTAYFYDPRGQMSGSRNPRGVRTAVRHDALGRQVRVTRAVCTPDQATTSHGFDRCGRRLFERDPVGGVHLMGRYAADGTRISGYDARGLLHVQTDPLGHLTVTQYDARGHDVVVSRFGHRAGGGYELLARLQSVRDEHGDVVESRDAVIAPPMPTADPIAAPDAEFMVAKAGGTVVEAVTSYELDADGRAVRIRLPGGGIITRRYDPQGRLWDERTPDGRRVVRLYDETGHLLRAYVFEPASAPAEGAVGTAVFMEEYDYDALGRRTLVRDAFGNEWSDAYDSLGNLVAMHTPLGIRTTLVYTPFGEEIVRTEGIAASGIPAVTRRRRDPVGNVVAVIDPLGRELRFAHDALDRIIEEINLSSGTAPARHVYDRADRLVHTTDRNGTVRVHQYDAAGRRIRTDYDWSTSVSAPSPLAASFVALGYDPLGHIVRHENDWVTVAIQRDSRGAILQETVSFSPTSGLAPLGWQVEQTFDASNDRRTLTYPSGRVVRYNRDLAGRVTSVENISLPGPHIGSGVTATAGILATFEYAGRRWRRARFPPAGVLLTLSYDGRAQVCDRIVRDEISGASVWRLQQVLNADRQTSLEQADVNGGSRSRRFFYDNLGRLTAYTDGPVGWIDPTALAPPQQPVNPTASPTQAAIDALIGVASPATPAFSYDLVGNRVNTAEPGTAAFASVADTDNKYVSVGASTWTHDPEGRVLSDGRRAFTYDGDGALVEEFDLTAGGAPTRTAGFVRDGLGRVAAVRLDGGQIVRLAYSDRTPIAALWPSHRIEYTPGRLADEPVHVAGGGQDTWIVHDGVRSPRLAIRHDGTLAVNRLSFRPFGAPEGAAFDLPFGFAGMTRFPGSSLLHSALRSYRPDLGRFLQPDPAGLLDGVNRFVYASNSPVDNFDPLGLQTLTPSDERVLAYLEHLAAELKVDPTHASLPASSAGSNKHLEFQFAAGNPGKALSDVDAKRIAPEIWIDEAGKIIKVDAPPNGAPANVRTVDIGIVKESVPDGRHAILGQRAEDVLDYAVDYKTGNAALKERRALETLIGGKPVVKVTGKAGELVQALRWRFAILAEAKITKKVLAKKAVKWGLKRIPKALPIVGAIFTYSTAEGSQGERVARAAAGEVGVGPFDLEMAWDAVTSMQHEFQTRAIRHLQEDPDIPYELTLPPTQP